MRTHLVRFCTIAVFAFLAACGKPAETPKIKLGFIALTDCAPLVIAQEKGYFAKHGLPNVEVVKQASWASTRDNLELGGARGGIDGADILTPMIYQLNEGIGTKDGKAVPMQLLARLDLNAQSISASDKLPGMTPTNAAPLKGRMAKVAMTYPGGTHDLWIRYWLASNGLDPDKDVDLMVVPPPQMVANMKVGNLDALCVGEPWGQQLIDQHLGYTVATSQDIWKDHPEKSLGLRKDWVDAHPKETMELLEAVMEAQIWADKPGEQGGTVADPVQPQLDRNAGRGPPASAQGRRGLRRRQARPFQRSHEVLAGPRELPLQEPRRLVPGRDAPLGILPQRGGLRQGGGLGEPLRPVAQGRRRDRSRKRRARHRQPVYPAAWVQSVGLCAEGFASCQSAARSMMLSTAAGMRSAGCGVEGVAERSSAGVKLSPTVRTAMGILWFMAVTGRRGRRDCCLPQTPKHGGSQSERFTELRAAPGFAATEGNL